MVRFLHFAKFHRYDTLTIACPSSKMARLKERFIGINIAFVHIVLNLYTTEL